MIGASGDLHDILAKPGLDAVPLNGLCQVEDFGQLRPWLELLVPFGRASFGDQYPDGVEYRKHWEVAQAVRALAIGGAIHPDAEILGIAAGNEPTIFCLTNFCKRVFATDLYLADGWEESANTSMVVEPGSTWKGPWNPRRLVVQHMNALDLRYEDCTFDGAFSSSSLEHFGEYEAIAASMREAFRILKPGGVYALSTEFRISGPPPGLPGILMFDWEELVAHVIQAAPWEMIGPVQIESRRPSDDPVVSFAKAAAAVTAHVAKYGELMWDRLNWPEYPHVRLSEGDLVWTSVHLALRRPRN
jgi:SAM-dependent methyltransferase